MIEALPQLIDKQDTIEIVRDQVALILLQNVARQMELATAAGKDPELWRVRIFTERAAPWEEWLGDPDPGEACAAPLVNVAVEAATYEKAGSTSSHTRTVGRLRLEVFASGVHSEAPNGQVPGDEMAGKDTLRAARLCRNILMAEQYQLLGLRGLVGGRRMESLTMLHHEPLVRPTQPVRAAVLMLEATFNEHSPKFEGEAIEELSVALKRKETGEVYLTATILPVPAP